MERHLQGNDRGYSKRKRYQSEKIKYIQETNQMLAEILKRNSINTEREVNQLVRQYIEAEPNNQTSTKVAKVPESPTT